MNVLNKPHLNINASDTRISHRRLSNENSTRRNPINFNPHTQDKDSSVVVQISSEASRMLAGKTSNVAEPNTDSCESPSNKSIGVGDWNYREIFWRTDCIKTNAALDTIRIRNIWDDDSICDEVRMARLHRVFDFLREQSASGGVPIRHTVEELNKNETFRAMTSELEEISALRSRVWLTFNDERFVHQAEETHQMLLDALARFDERFGSFLDTL